MGDEAVEAGQSAPRDEEQQLVARAQAGDVQAVEALVRRYERWVFTLTLRMLGNRAEAEDLAQETFLKVYRYRACLREPEKFPAWLLAIARNAARDRRRRRQETPAPLPAAAATPDPQARPPGWWTERLELGRELDLAVAGLPDRQRLAVTLRYLDGLDHEAIRRRLGWSDGTLRGVLGRALQALRHHVQLARLE